MEQLAQDTGISVTALDRLRSGESAITYNQLKRIAEYFGRGVLFFLEDGPVDVRAVYTNTFRTLANQKTELDSVVKKIIERTEWQREAYLSLRSALGNEDMAQFKPPVLTDLTIDQAAERTRAWLALDGVNNFDGFRLAVERKGILVFRSNGYQGKWQLPKENQILGFSLYHETLPLIFVKKARFESRQNFTLMHELAHLLVHKESIIDEEGDFYSRTGKEREANVFAARVLVPDSFLVRIDDSIRPRAAEEYDHWLKPYRAAWGASSEVILLRLLDAGRIGRRDYAAYRQWSAESEAEEERGGVRQYRYREPRHIFGDKYVRTVLAALEQQKITITKASKFLDGLKVNDLHKLEEYCASH